MIEGIDGNALLNAFRQGKSDRYADQDRQMKMQRAQQQQNVMAQLFTGQSQAPSSPAQPAQPTFAQAFSPEAQTAMTNGTELPALPTMTGGGVIGQAMPRQKRPQLNEQVFAQLDPEMQGQIATMLKNRSDTELKQEEARQAAIGSAAEYLLTKVPEEKWPQFYQQVIAPHLREANVSEEQIALNANQLTREALGYHSAASRTTQQVIENSLKEREFQAGKVMAPTPGSGLFRIRPDSVETIVAPNDGSKVTGSPVTAAPVTVTNADDYAKVPPGASYMDPQGHVRQKPGGPTPQASGGF
jgi:hypothetical protein